MRPVEVEKERRLPMRSPGLLTEGLLEKWAAGWEWGSRRSQGGKPCTC